METSAQLNSDLVRAESLKTAGRLGEAAELLEALCRANPEHAEAHLRYGRLAWELQRPELALKLLGRADELDPGSAGAMNELAEVYFALGRLDDADRALRESLARAPGNADIHVKRALISLRRKDRAAAKELCEKALAFDPGFVGAHQLLGTIAWEDGALEETARHLLVARQSGQPISDPYGILAWSLFTLGRAAEIERQGPCADEGQLFIEVMLQAIAAWQQDETELCRQQLLRANRLFASLGETPNKGVFSPFLIVLEALLARRDGEDRLYDGAEDETAEGLYALGDDHCLSAAHLPVEIDGHAHRIRPSLVVGCKAQHLAEARPSHQASAFAAALARLPAGARVLVSLGELDCRYRAGLLPGLRDKPAAEADAVVEDLVRRYVANVVELAAPRELRLSFLTPPARNLHLRHVPTYDRPLYNRIVERFAETLRQASAARGLPLVDLHAVTIAPEGGARAELYLDSNHVYPEAIVAAFRTS